jgi:hypothetical protein
MTTKASHFPMFLAVVGCRKLHSNYSGVEEAVTLQYFDKRARIVSAGGQGVAL